MKKSIILTALVVICTLVAPATVVKAVPPPELSQTVMTEAELANHNLSLGTISWDDDLVFGSIEVTNGPMNDYMVCSEEVYKINDIARTKKELAKNAARGAFKDVRKYAQTKGWWDCQWKIKSTSKKKVTATATVEFKSVTMDRNSRSITIKQTTKKSGKKWKTTYTVGGKKISVDDLKKLFT